MLNLAATSFEKADYKFRRECLAAKFVVAANFAVSMDLADTNFIVWNRLSFPHFHHLVNYAIFVSRVFVSVSSSHRTPVKAA